MLNLTISLKYGILIMLNAVCFNIKFKERSVQMNIRTNQANLLVDFVIRYPDLFKEISKRIRLDITNIEVTFYEFSSEDQCHTKIRRSNLKGLQYNGYEVLYEEEYKNLKIQILFKWRNGTPLQACSFFIFYHTFYVSCLNCNLCFLISHIILTIVI